MKKILSLITAFILTLTLSVTSVYAYDEDSFFDPEEFSDFLLLDILSATDLPYYEEFLPQSGINYDLTIGAGIFFSGGIMDENGEIVFEFSAEGDEEFGYSFEYTLQFPDDSLYTFYINKPESFSDDDMILVLLTDRIQNSFTDIELYDERVVNTSDLPLSIEFTPDETADYAVISESPVTLKGNITDEDGNEIISFESVTLPDYYDTLCAYAELEEGKTYYFNLDKYPYDSDEEVIIDICKLTGYLYDVQDISYYEDGEEYCTDVVLVDSYHGSDTELDIESIEGEVMAIGQYAFENKMIKTVTLAEGFESIYNFAFLNCKDLYKVTFPDSLSVITYGAFLGCDNLKEISIGKDIYLIEPYAFGYDENYQKIDGFVIKGYEGTAAQKYAEENGFEFISLSGNVENTSETDEELTTDEVSGNTTEPTDPTTQTTETETVEITTDVSEESTSQQSVTQQNADKVSQNVSQTATQSEVKQTVNVFNTDLSGTNASTGSKSYVVVIFIIVLALFAAVVVIRIIRIKKQK